MIVWTVDGRTKALDLQWIDPGAELYRFGVKLPRAFYENEKRSGHLAETVDWWLTDGALEGLFADSRRQVVLQGFSPREEIVRLAVAAPVGELVWTETGMFRLWKRLTAPGEHAAHAAPDRCPRFAASYRGIPFYLGSALDEPPGVLQSLRAALSAWAR